MIEEKPKNLQIEYENEFVHKKLEGFEPKSSQAWQKLTERFGPKISHDEILSLAIILSENMKISLSREYKRRKIMLIKWFDENFENVWPFIEKNVVIKDSQGNEIKFSK